jgi:hypothetical protein
VLFEKGQVVIHQKVVRLVQGRVQRNLGARKVGNPLFCRVYV